SFISSLYLFSSMLPPPPQSTLFPYTTLFRSPIFESHPVTECRIRTDMKPRSMTDTRNSLEVLLSAGTLRLGRCLLWVLVWFSGRSEERRVGKECSFALSRCDCRKRR